MHTDNKNKAFTSELADNLQYFIKLIWFSIKF